MEDSSCHNKKQIQKQKTNFSTIPRTLEEHEELDNLNKNFSKNLEEINKEKDSLPSTSKKGKKVIRDEENEEKINENKKRMGHKQGERKDSDEE
ncbi:unnamed protein product [Rhizophagus irregularis]|nr:unnamed protein product [Rhizophagus irregularis]